jgi:hypothetical protein
MNYNKIKRELVNRRIPITEFITDKVQMSIQGFNTAIKNKTLTILKLERISEALGLPMSFWFQDEDFIVREKQGQYDKPDKEEKRLNSIIDELRDDKARLKRENDELREKMGLGKVGS